MKDLVHLLREFTGDHQLVMIEPERLKGFAAGTKGYHFIGFHHRLVFLFCRRADLNAYGISRHYDAPLGAFDRVIVGGCLSNSHKMTLLIVE